MDEAELKKIFRATELERRQFRRRHLLTVQNEAKLLEEELSPEDRKAHQLALNAIVMQEKYYQKMLDEIRGGYWTRLWRALRGKY